MMEMEKINNNVDVDHLKVNQKNNYMKTRFY